MTSEATPGHVPFNDQLGLEPERAAFEHWFSEGGKWPDAVRRSGDGYMLAAAQSAWTAWQACWPLARATIYSAEQAQIEAPLKTALRWYADEAEAIARNVLAKNTNAMMASMQVLALDAGKRARDAGA